MSVKYKHSYRPTITIFAVSIILTGAYLLTKSTLSPEPVGVNLVTSGGNVSLTTSYDKTRILPNTYNTMSLNISSGTDQVTAVQLELEFDPAQVEVTSFVNTGYFPIFLANYVINNGKVTATLGVTAESGGKAGSGTIGYLTVRPLTPGTHSLTFGDGTLTASTTSETNTLGAVSAGTFNAIHPGDMNGDTHVDIYDYNAFVPEFNKTGNPGFSLADFVLDGKIDIYDYNSFVTNFGKSY